jgi:hypothetical protein
MSAKNSSVKDTIGNVGKGILDSLQDSVDETREVDNIIPEQQKRDNVVLEESTDNVLEKSKRVNTRKSNDEKKEKRKTSFMLNDKAIQQLKMLNLAIDKDLSEMVIDSIDMYYRKHEKKVQEVIESYFQSLKK